MAEAIVSVVVETLGNLLKEEVRFPNGVRGQVEELRTELWHLQSLLKDADRKQHGSETIRNWIKEIRRLAYRAEDLLEEYVVKVGSGNGDQGFIKRFKSFANDVGNSRVLGSEIETILSKIRDLTGKKDELRIIVSNDQEETSDEKKQRFIRKTYAHEELQHFVGMDEDIKKLVSLLVSDEESGHGVIGIWGMGGSGKTTVSRKVYNHINVKRFFDSFAWVCITQKCQIRSVMQEIFRQLLPEKKEDIKEMSVDELVVQIYNLQMEKKCLIVLDDIWNLDDWNFLKKCLPTVGSHSKVLLTTRNRIVAEIGNQIKLKGFTEDEAWKLLRMKAFPKSRVLSEPGYSEYEKLGRTMIRKCDRLPLAVAVLGGILSAKNSLHEWKLASEDVNSYIGRGEGIGVAGEVEKVLALSYDELPYHLKPCFLSLGCLQEDERAYVELIYGSWMAQGFIQSKHVGSSETMHDLAKCYLNELQFRSMVQFHDLMSISLHDSILDMCRSKAKEEEFLKVVNKCNISEKAYRLVVRPDDEDNDLNVLKAVENITPLRSFYITRELFSKSIDLPKKFFILPQIKSLRVLIVCGCNLRGECFHRIENLIHLRFLGLMDCDLEIFSLESVGKLSFLQTLCLTGTTLTLMKLLPVDTFCKMRQLKHLYLPTFLGGVGIEGKLRLMNLSQLETLDHFHSKIYDWKDLIHLQKLRSLRCCVVNDDESLVQITDYICESNLRWIDISIKNCDLNGQQESDALRKLLKTPNVTLELGICSRNLLKLPRLKPVDFSKMCPGLVKLELYGMSIAEDIMQTLGKFPNLKILRLLSVRFGGEEIICDAGSFPRLEYLALRSVEGKFEMRIDEAAMPNLSSMLIRRCSGINLMIPERLSVVN